MFPTGLTSVYNGQILDRFMKNRNKEGRRNVKQYKMAIMYEIKMIVFILFIFKQNLLLQRLFYYTKTSIDARIKAY